ncbi:unnamed protein product [Schistosoma curassoni]|uniref:CCHC-type domain-containing protein n=1 Tax=Schistosoma curassoni TaxID=6186 RepID=A0A183KY87_9TREM|nr:unnamed protein product [Schistosoma curassoni]
MERFKIWTMTKEDVEDVNILASFLTFIGKEAYSLLKTLTFSEKPILLSYVTLKELLLDHVKCTDFERCNGAKSPGMVRQDIQNTTTLLRHPNPMGTQGYADNNSLRSRDAGQEDEHKFGRCLSCGEVHSCNSCVLRNAKCFKCGEIRHIHAVCDTAVHFTVSNAQLCSSYSIKSNFSNESYSNHIHGIILPHVRFSHESRISNEIIYKYVEDISSKEILIRTLLFSRCGLSQ